MTNFIVCVGTWPNDNQKEKQLETNLREISRGGFDYGLATHFPEFDSAKFPESKFFVYDSQNTFSSLDSPLFNLGFHRIHPQSWSSFYDCDNYRFRTRRGSGSHTFPIMRSIISCCQYSDFLGYDYMIYIEEDVVWTPKVSERVFEIAQKVKFENLDFFFTESRNLPGTINPCFFVIRNQFLLKNINMGDLKNLEAFHSYFPNKITEDILLDLVAKSKKYLVETQEKMTDIFGDYGIGWDTSQVGKSMETQLTTASIKAFSVNHLFLQKQGLSFNLGFLQTIHHLTSPLAFKANVSLVDETGESQTIFVAENELQPYTYFYWPDFFVIEPKVGSHLEINTSTSTDTINVEESYKLKLDERELISYSSLFEYSKKI